jgi:hypothetical protein
MKGRMLLVLVVLWLVLAGYDDSYTVQGQYTDDRGVLRVVGIDNRDGALVTIPKVQVPGEVKSGECIIGGLIYHKTKCEP